MRLEPRRRHAASLNGTTATRPPATPGLQSGGLTLRRFKNTPYDGHAAAHYAALTPQECSGRWMPARRSGWVEPARRVLGIDETRFGRPR